MSIKFRCEHCNTTLRARPEKSGRRAKCKNCGGVVKVPEATEFTANDEQSAKQKRSAPGRTRRAKAKTPHQEATRSQTSQPSPTQPSLAPPKSGQTDAVEPPRAPVEAVVNALPPAVPDDPFANLPEFQTLEAPVERQFEADEEFQRLMMGDQQSQLFNVATHTANAAPTEEAADVVPMADHDDIAGIIGSFDSAIHTAVERSVRPKFSVDQIRAAFRKPLANAEHMDSLRGKQFFSAVSVALVPIGFVCFVVLGSIGLIWAVGTFLVNDTGQILNPFIGLPMILLAIALLLGWIPAISLMIAGVSLLFPRRFDAPAADPTDTREPAGPVRVRGSDLRKTRLTQAMSDRSRL